MLRTTFTTALLLACTVMAAAQSTLTGKWQGDTDGGAALALDLTVKGDALTGTLTRERRRVRRCPRARSPRTRSLSRPR